MELLTVGKISGTHHLKGAVKVVSNIENIEILLNNRVGARGRGRIIKESLQ